MIPFDEIDSRLGNIGKDRLWLAQASGRKISSINTSLAPNADDKNRSALLQRVLSEVIEAEENRVKTGQEPPPAYLTIETTIEEYRAWEDAAYSEEKKLTQWALDAIRTAYTEATQPAVIDKPLPFPKAAEDGAARETKKAVGGKRSAGSTRPPPVPESHLPTG